MKLINVFSTRILNKSHPSRGAWIEMRLRTAAVPRVTRRTPHGVRGLKLRLIDEIMPVLKSHPSRGAWIEICNNGYIDYRCRRRTPHGVRGLK